ncbi:MAG: flagellar export chaperone FliS [Lachnospiraceae bacterium]|jgi:flagellar protein FliS|nr:flagellar export chaperone FliS [Lachnospiraceae bacterium]
MAPRNPYATYNNNKVLSATPAELTLMLYEGAIKFCNLAKVDIEKKEYGDSIGHIQRARNIIVELQSTLDFKYPVAKDFDTIYQYIFLLMTEVNKNHDLETLEELLVELRELRDIWKMVMKAAKQPQASSDKSED